MKTRIFTAVATVAALGVGLFAATPAKADHGFVDVGFHYGPAYVRYHDGFRRVGRIHYDYFSPRRGGWRLGNRWYNARDLWHLGFDGRWYRYDDRRYWKRYDRRWRKLNRRRDFRRHYRGGPRRYYGHRDYYGPRDRRRHGPRHRYRDRDDD